MSNNENTIYLERAKESFEIALAEMDYKHCQVLIDELREDGFGESADYLQKKLDAVPDDEGYDKELVPDHLTD